MTPATARGFLPPLGMATGIESFARRQNAVITARQARAAGLTKSAVRARLARGRWQVLRPGVYLTHSGPIGPTETARAVVLAAGEGAVLSHESALWVRRVGPAPAVWTVLVPHGRRRTVEGAQLIRTRRVIQRRSVNSFPTSSLQSAVIDVADREGSSVDEITALIATLCQKGLTTPERIVAELASRRAHRLRRPLQLVLGDVAGGVESLAEHRFLTDVIRAHGLPDFASQVRSDQGRADFHNHAFGVRAEVDGLAFHAGRFRADRQRDRRASAQGITTIRVTWWDVDRDPCDVAHDLAQILRRRGWRGSPVACSPACQLGSRRPA